MVDRNRPARYELGQRATLKATGQPVEILDVRRGEFVPDFVYKVRVLAERPARPYNLSVPEHDFQTFGPPKHFSTSAGQQVSKN